MHTEEDYNAQYGLTAPEPEEGQGLCNLLTKHGVETAGPALEIGCGTGYLTYGFARHYPGPDILITDPSPAFLRITQNQFDPAAAYPAKRHYAVLNADDLGDLPAGMFSVIALRSTLHHILKVDEFIAACARVLRPGGALVMGAEPCESGYLLMAAVAQSIPNAFKAAGIAMKPEWTRRLDDFTATVKFCCLRDLDKSTAEDKHFFSPHQLSNLGAGHGLHLTFFPTASLPRLRAALHPQLPLLQPLLPDLPAILHELRRGVHGPDQDPPERPAAVHRRLPPQPRRPGHHRCFLAQEDHGLNLRGCPAGHDGKATWFFAGHGWHNSFLLTVFPRPLDAVRPVIPGCRRTQTQGLIPAQSSCDISAPSSIPPT